MSEAEENVSVPTDNDLPQENPQPAHLERNETSTETSSTSKTRGGRLVKKPDRLGLVAEFWCLGDFEEGGGIWCRQRTLSRKPVRA
ncbi:Hypothetical predicted protein, partial [Paramuricea clavata]